MRERVVIKVAQPQTFHQLGIVVLDGSGSMSEPTASKITKAEETSGAVKNLFSRFKISSQRSNFSFAVVCYDHEANMSLDITPVKDLNANDDYNPLALLGNRGGGTYIHEGLRVANEIAERFLQNDEQGGVPHKVIIMLMSDGLDMQEQKSLGTANQIKQNPKIQIACSFLKTLGGDTNLMQQGADFLKQICTDPNIFYEETQDAEGLRSFFERSMSAAAGKNLFG